MLSTLRIDGILILLKSVGGWCLEGREDVVGPKCGGAAPDAASARAARSTRRRTASSGSPANGNQRACRWGGGGLGQQLRRGK